MKTIKKLENKTLLKAITRVMHASCEVLIKYVYGNTDLYLYIGVN